MYPPTKRIQFSGNATYLCEIYTRSTPALPHPAHSPPRSLACSNTVLVAMPAARYAGPSGSASVHVAAQILEALLRAQAEDGLQRIMASLALAE